MNDRIVDTSNFYAHSHRHEDRPAHFDLERHYRVVGKEHTEERVCRHEQGIPANSSLTLPPLWTCMEPLASTFLPWCRTC